MTETGNEVGTPELTGTAVPTKTTTVGSRDVPLGILLAVVGYARCRAKVHDGSARGCSCAEIAGRMSARASV